MRTLVHVVLLALLHTVTAAAQAPPDDFLKRVEQLGIEAAKLRTPPPAAVLTVDVPPGDGTLQAAVLKALPFTTLQLQPGATYTGSVILPKIITDLRITTKGFAPGPRLVTLDDVPLMATFQATPGQSYGIWIMGSRITVDGLHVLHNPSLCQGDLLRVGDSANPNPADTPDAVTLTQNVLEGSSGPACGQKRGMAANGAHLTITKNFITNIWAPGQDSQAIAIFSTPGPVTIMDNVLLGGSETVLVGGVPPAAASMLPSDILVEHNIIARPLAWLAYTNRQIKNLIEAKAGRRITFRRNVLLNHWVDAQPGYSMVLTMATNGACSWCVLEDTTVEDNLVLNVAAGINILGYQYLYAPGAGQGQRFTIRNNYVVLVKALARPGAASGNGRFLVLSGQPKDVRVDHNTIVHDGSAVVAGDYGTKWPFQSPPLPRSVPAGPVEGFVFTHNVAWHSTYGIFTPEGSSGLNLGTYFPGAVIAQNVWGGASSTVVARYNTYAGGQLNTTMPLAAFQAALTVTATTCPTPVFSEGVDCTRLPYDLLPLAQQLTAAP